MRVRHQAYRKSWISRQQRAVFVDAWAGQFAQWKFEHQQGQITGPEICALILDRVWRDLFPKAWRNGSRETAVPPASAILFGSLSIKLRGIPESVQRSLERWSQGEYQLQLLFHEPRMEDVMALQARGQRCISLMIQRNQILDYEHDGRDFLSFLIHDLIHADHLMRDPQAFARQVKFSRWLESIWSRVGEALREERWSSQRVRLEYVSADMNSHIVHLLKTLKALIQELQLQGLDIESELWSAFEGGFQRPADGFRDDWAKLNSAEEDQSHHLSLIESWDELPSQSHVGSASLL